MTFVVRQQVRFGQVDAAGIVFYPRYFEMLNAAVEDYFAHAVGTDFAEMHMRRHIGTPTVKLDAEFLSPSRLGDMLEFRIKVARVGLSSADLLVEIVGDEELRVRISLVLVCMDLTTGKAIAWPTDMRPQPKIE